MIDILGTVVEYRNLESGQHVERVKGYTKILAERLMEDFPEYGLTDEMVQTIVSASALHDIGKIAIPDEILLKPGRLTSEELFPWLMCMMRLSMKEYIRAHIQKNRHFK